MLKTISLLIVTVLCLGLGACGGGNDPPKSVAPSLDGCSSNNLPATVAPKFGNRVTAGTSSLVIPYGPGGYVTSANWYFPTRANGTVSANGLVWLQCGDMATAIVAELAAQIADQTNSIVVVPVISSFEIPTQPGRYLGSEAMQLAVAEMMVGDRVALAKSATAAGYPGVLPRKFLFAGQLTGGGFAAGVGAGTVDNGAARDLLGVVMFNGLASPVQFYTSVAKLDSLGIPIYQIASPPQAGNNWGSTTELLALLHPDQFVGVQLDDGSAFSAAITLATGWINDIYRGFGPTNPFYGIYGNPNDGTYVANQPIMVGETGGTVLPAPPPVDINQYAGTWYEQGSVKKDPSVVLVNVKAVYTPQPDGSIKVENSGKSVGPSGPPWSITGSAVAVNAPFNTRLSVSFSGEPNRNEPGNYWILDYAPDYSWVIVSDANGTSGTILTRDQFASEARYNALVTRAYRLGVRSTITPTAQYP